MPPDPVCPRCAELIPPDEDDCPYCAHRKPFPLLHHEPVLIAAVVALALGLWMVTHGVTQAYGHRQDHLARTWYAAGDAALRQGRLDAAISDLQTALAYSHDSPNVRLRLAEALASAGRTRQAQAYLRALWDERPGDGTVNLELAQLATRTGDVPDAQRYYHGAIYGVWDSNPIVNRRRARLELIQFLLSRQALQQAQSELIALSTDLPPDSALLLRVGQMFLQAGDADRALAQFRAVAEKEPRQSAAFAGAGQAAFQLQNYTLARRFLQRAVALVPDDAKSAHLLQTSELVLQLDPYVSRIGRDERARRVLRAIEQTQNRLEKCAEQQQIVLDVQPPGGPVASDYGQLVTMKTRAKRRALRDDPELTDAVMDLVFRSQSDAASVCGRPEGADLALLLIGRANGGRP